MKPKSAGKSLINHAKYICSLPAATSLALHNSVYSFLYVSVSSLFLTKNSLSFLSGVTDFHDRQRLLNRQWLSPSSEMDLQTWGFFYLASHLVPQDKVPALTHHHLSLYILVWYVCVYLSVCGGGELLLTCGVVLQHRVLAEWLVPPSDKNILEVCRGRVVTTQSHWGKQSRAALLLGYNHLDTHRHCGGWRWG